MKQNILFTASAIAGLSCHAFAGDSEVAPMESVSPHNPWTTELSLLYMYAEGQGTDSHYNSQDHEYGYRFLLGYQPSPDSWGYSLDYTHFQGTMLPGSGESGPDFHVFDLMASNDATVNGFDFRYSLGLRYVDWEEPYNGGFDVNYKGWGPVVGVAGTHDLPGNFSLYGNAKVSYLFGKDLEDEASDDQLVWQAGAGVQYDLSCTCLEGAYVKLGYEFQHYAKLAYDNNDVSVDGLVLTLGYNF